MKPRGFTLIELMVAVLLLALLSGGAALSFRRPLQALRVESVVMTLRHFDTDARAAARASGQSQRVVFDLANHRVQRYDGPGLTTLRQQAVLSGEWKIQIDGRPVSAQSIPIDFSPNGWSRSYSVRFATRTLNVAGLTGEISEQP